MNSIRIAIAYNILDSVPFDIRDTTTTKLENVGSNFRINEWISCVVDSAKKIRLRLSGTQIGSKSVRNYKLTSKGALPDSFWETVNTHTAHNTNLRLKENAVKQAIKNTWPAFQEYIDATGYDTESWSKDNIKDHGHRSNLTISDTNNTSVCLSLDRKRRIQVTKLTIEDKYITPDNLKKILDIIEEGNTPPPEPAKVRVTKAKSLFDGVWEG